MSRPAPRPALRAATDLRPMLDMAVLDARLRGGDSPAAAQTEVIRAAHLVGLVLFTTAGLFDTPGVVDLPTIAVPLDLRSLSQRAGLRAADTSAAVTALRAAGILTPTDGTHATTTRFTGGAITPHPIAHQIAWREIVERLHGKVAALLVTRALADLLARPRTGGSEVAHPGEWRTVSSSQLVTATYYTEAMVRRGLELAETSGIIRRAVLPGSADKMRFSDAVLRDAAPAGADGQLDGWVETVRSRGGAEAALREARWQGRHEVPAAEPPSLTVAQVAEPRVAAAVSPPAPVTSPVEVPPLAIAPAGPYVLELGGTHIVMPAGVPFPVLPPGAQPVLRQLDAQGRPVFQVVLPA